MYIIINELIRPHDEWAPGRAAEINKYLIFRTRFHEIDVKENSLEQ